MWLLLLWMLMFVTMKLMVRTMLLILVESSLWLFSMYNPNHANGTKRFPVWLLNLVDHVNTNHSNPVHMISTTSHPVDYSEKKEFFFFICSIGWSQLKILPSTCLHSSMNFDRYHDYTLKMDCYSIHTMDHLMNHQHYLHSRQFLIYNSQPPNIF